VCDELSTSCPPDVTLPDIDADGLCDAQDPCTNIAGARDFLETPAPKVILGAIGSDTTPDNDRLSISGEFLLPPTVSFSQLRPETGGARVVIQNQAAATRLDARLPAGAYAGRGTRGWKQNGGLTKWTYLDRTASPVGGIVRMTTTARGDPASRQVRVAVKGRRGTYPIAAGDGPLRAAVVLGGPLSSQEGECGESDFQPGDCVFNGSQSRVTCKK
jgi:hypothetical protein